MTSNVGAEQIMQRSGFGFGVAGDDKEQEKHNYDSMRERVLGQLRHVFRPEFLNRIDNVIVFHSLNQPQIRVIVDLQLARIRKQLEEQEIGIEFTIEAMDLLGERGYDPQYGARPLRRIIQNLIEDPIAEGLLEGRFSAGDRIEVDVEDELLKIVSSAGVAPVG
jgi:ATP-dependent Clp protease ATP-binding subunit ClpC